MRAGPGSRRLPAAVLAVERIRLRMAIHGAAGETTELESELTEVERRLAGEEGRDRLRLAQIFGLSGPELDALDLSVAIAVEPMLGPMIGALQGYPDRPLASEIALRLLFGHGPQAVVRAAGAPLKWGLLVSVDYAPGEPGAWFADAATVDCYFSRVSPGDLPVRGIPKVTPLPEWDVASEVKRLAGLLKEQRPIRVAIRGRDGSGRASMAQCLADGLKHRAVLIDAALASGSGGQRAYLVAQRMGLLGACALVWRGVPEEPPGAMPICPLQFFTLTPDALLPARENAIDIHLDVPPMTPKSLGKLSRLYLPKMAKALDQSLMRPLAGDLAMAGAQQISNSQALSAWLRQRNASRAKHVGRIESAEFDWNDLVLADPVMGQLKSFAAEARQRANLLAQPERRRVFSGSAHLSAMFTGAPGLGKSMSAKVIARELGLDLLFVDTSALVSKYIGDTAKNMTEVFAVAREFPCVLVFEEADGICGARVKQETSNDKHHNADTGHLLQLMERHDGVVILSTNKRGNVDPAFMRRLRYIIEYRRPSQLEAERIWDNMLQVAGLKANARRKLVPSLAAAHDMTPAQIKGAAITASYRALARGTAVSGQDVEEGIRFEFQKEGKLVNAVPGSPTREAQRG